MRKGWMLFLLAVLTLLSGCVAHTLEGSGYPVYFLDRAEDGGQALKAERRTLDPDLEPVEGLLQVILSGPESETLTNVIPASVSLRG